MFYRTEVTIQDIEKVNEIVSSTKFFHDDELVIAVELVNERLQKGLASGYEFIFAEIAGKTVAYSCYGEIPATLGSYDLYWLVTHQSYRGQGIGKQLLAVTEKAIRQRQGRAIYVETAAREQYAPTHHFYERCQYIKEAQLKDFYAVGDDKIIYVKRFEGTIL